MELNRPADAQAVFRDLEAFAIEMTKQPAKIDYFATSLPNLLVFDEDLQARHIADARLLLALAAHGQGNDDVALTNVAEAAKFDRCNQVIATLSKKLSRQN